MIYRELIITFIILLLFISCATNNGNKIEIKNVNSSIGHTQAEIFLNIPGLANKSSSEVEKVIGNSTNTKSEQLLSLKEGKIREFQLNKIRCEIGFYQDMAVEFNCNLEENMNFENPKEMAQSFGFTVLDNNYSVSPRAIYLKGEFGGTNFKSITVAKTNTDKYARITAEVGY